MFWFIALVALSILISWFLTQRINRRFPPTGSFFRTRNGARLHYEILGEKNADRETLVLIHGASSNLLDFSSSIAPLLADQFRVLLVDRPGLGHSERKRGIWPDPVEQAELIEELLGYLDIRDPVLVGHSWAGALVMAHLYRFPDQARAGILIAPAIHSWDGPSAAYNRLSRLPVIGWLFRWTLVVPLGSLTMDGGIRSIFHNGRVPPNYRENAGIDLILRPPSWYANAEDLCLLNSFLKKTEHRYTEVAQPLLALTGENDEIVWNEIHIGGLSKQVNNLTVISYPDTGHSPHQSHPEMVAREIIDFVDVSRDEISPVTN